MTCDHVLVGETQAYTTLTLVSFQVGDKLESSGFQLEDTDLSTVVCNEGILAGRVIPAPLLRSNH